MRNYLVNVNGTSYEVAVEEISGNAAAAPAPAKSAPAAASAPSAPAAPAPVAKAGEETVVCPMPGTILDVSCAVGSPVKYGDVLMILEAMKMENEILCPKDGTLTALNVTKGATVEPGQVLCIIG